MKNVIDLFFREEDEVGNVVLDETVIFRFPPDAECSLCCR
jgi:hypothetical protein